MSKKEQEQGEGLPTAAYRWEQYTKMKTDSVTTLTEEHPSIHQESNVDVDVVPDSIEVLYTAEDIQALIEEKIDKEKAMDDSVTRLSVPVLEELLEEVKASESRKGLKTGKSDSFGETEQ